MMATPLLLNCIFLHMTDRANACPSLKEVSSPTDTFFFSCEDFFGVLEMRILQFYHMKSILWAAMNT